MLLAGGLSAAALMLAPRVTPAENNVTSTCGHAASPAPPSLRTATVNGIFGLHRSGDHRYTAPQHASLPAAKQAPSDHANADALDLSKLDRVQLLQLLRDAMEENDRLRAQVAEANRRAEEAEKKLEDRRIQIEDSESLAEASLRLAGIFVDAQHAIDLYGYNVEQNKLGGGSPSRGVATSGAATPVQAASGQTTPEGPVEQMSAHGNDAMPARDDAGQSQ